ncbi:helix-turn-helix transcriptional regulator [Wenyingzhuangia sp. chi5]|uniref:Helix-turn-helix transcriptional regulator n=1 Tax=Wenyingzhuangia gilva TaxID=3057677 RepID=A0ABT8VS31_9FLAO|nr:helix-turn-helix transcriptional regulator [Wenyingzhuangia sp. chi5]MDO3694776.1 helix-turn-helix transcriptional regulator [Wenyingzhuangia sp. chi5]
MNKVPVYNIQNFNFNTNIHKNHLYINTFKNHLIEHSFIEKSHRHNFYLLVLFTNGTGRHQIDLDTYNIKRGSLYVIKPGQAHGWELSNDIEGYIVFYSSEIYNLYFGNKKIEEYPFYQPDKNISEIVLNEQEIIDFNFYFKLLIQENQQKKSRKAEKLLNIIDIIHIEISRKFLSENNYSFQTYHHKIQVFNKLLEQYYKSEKSPTFYAKEMNITLKHLNRICKDLLDKTVTELITQKIILESKRMLTFGTAPINEIAQILGYEDYSYFSRLFKKHTQYTPSKFRASLKKDLSTK